MPTYNYKCLWCDHEFSMVLRMKDHASVTSCTKCAKKAKQVVGLPMVNIPQNMRATDSSDYYGKQASVPINICDEQPDGSYKVTRIGKKEDIDNE